MIKREKGNVVFHCDNCSEYFTLDTDDFNETLAALKEEKWKYQKEKDGGWSHYCPECNKEEEEKDDRKVPDRSAKRTQPRRQNVNRR
jgi:hypothetical protein